MFDPVTLQEHIAYSVIHQDGDKVQCAPGWTLREAIRGQKVMLDFDLAKLYQIETKALKQAVRRNLDRFPSDFMFTLSQNEYNSLKISIRSQFVTLAD